MMIDKAVSILRSGGVIVFPTDTVWGIGAWIESKKGVEKLYKIKKRDLSKPTAILVGNVEQAKMYGEFSDRALNLVDKYWPGALTVIVKGGNDLPKEVLNSDGGVGIRISNNELVRKICEEIGGGIVASSANTPGVMAPTERKNIEEKLISHVDLMLDGDMGISGVSSTVVDCMSEEMKILRQGDIRI